MAPKDSLLRRLQHLDQSGSSERQAARRKRSQQSSGEILQTFLAYKLDHAAEKMAMGIAIGDPLTLLHEPTNKWDPNAVKAFWKQEWIGYIPKDMAALIAAEVPEVGTGLEAVVTGLTTTSRRDAFRLQISIPIPKASRRLRELGVSSTFAWDFDRVPSETTRVRKRQDRLKELEEKQEDINTRLETSRAEERRLRRDFDFNKRTWEQRAEKAQEQGEQAIELAQSVEGQLSQQLDLKEQELQLALAENKALDDQLEQSTNELDALRLELEYLEQPGPPGAANELSYTPWSSTDGEVTEQEVTARLLNSLRDVAGSARLKPRQCLELVSEQLCSGHLLVLESAWASADQVKGFEHGDQLFELLWLLATGYREQKLAGAPDRMAGQVFGGKNYAPRESESIERNPKSKRDRTFSYQGKTVEMWQHLKIGAKDSENHTLRIHFCWDEELNQVVIGHCGKHLFNPNH